MATIANARRQQVTVDLNEERTLNDEDVDNIRLRTGLSETVKGSQRNKLFFDQCGKAIDVAQTFISVNTPTKTYGKEKNAADLKYIGIMRNKCK
jgi:hypothetical protein